MIPWIFEYRDIWEVEKVKYFLVMFNNENFVAVIIIDQLLAIN